MDDLDDWELPESVYRELGEARLEPTSLASGTELMRRLGPGNSSDPVAAGKVKKAPMNSRPRNMDSSKDAKALRKEVIALTKRAEDAEEKVSEFREKLKTMRAALATKDKQLGIAKRSVEYLGVERDQLQADRISEQAHSRKLEAKVNAQKGMAEMVEQWRAMKAKAKRMEETVHTAESRLLAAEEVQRSQKAEINTLRAALDVRARELSSAGGQDVSQRLLYAVAKSREEGVALAVQLAEQKEHTQHYQNELSKAQLQLQRVEGICESYKSQKEEFESEAMQARAEARHALANGGAAAGQVRVLTERSERLQEDKDNLEDELLRARDRIARLEDEVNAARHSAKRSAESSRHDMVAALEDLTTAASRQQQELEEAMQRTTEQHRQEMERVMGEKVELQRRVGQADAEVGIHKARLQEMEAGVAVGQRDLKQQVSNLHAEIDGLTEVNHRLQSNLDMARRGMEAEEMHNKNLQKQSHKVEEECARLSAALKEATASAQGEVKAEHEKLVRENCRLSDEREQLAAELSRILGLTESTRTEKESLQREVDHLKEMNEGLAQSKMSIQQSMIEQVAEVKGQLKAMERENAQLREAAAAAEQQRQQQEEEQELEDAAFGLPRLRDIQGRTAEGRLPASPRRALAAIDDEEPLPPSYGITRGLQEAFLQNDQAATRLAARLSPSGGGGDQSGPSSSVAAYSVAVRSSQGEVQLLPSGRPHHGYQRQFEDGSADIHGRVDTQGGIGGGTHRVPAPAGLRSPPDSPPMRPQYSSNVADSLTLSELAGLDPRGL